MDTGRHFSGHRLRHRRWCEALASFTVGMDPPSERGASVESDRSPPIGGAQPSPWTGTAEGGPGPGSPDPRGAGALPPFPDWALWPLGTRPTGSRRLIPSPFGSQAPRMEKEFEHQFTALQPAHDRWQWAHPGGTAASEPLVTGRKSRIYCSPPPLSMGARSKTPNGRLKPQLVLTPVDTTVLPTHTLL